MSGICGFFALDGGAAELGRMLAKLERRGPDATRQWRDGPVALGHTLLATTPEALVERLPLTDAASGCTITADVRLDNREELIAALGQSDETRIIGDGELILRAYLEWGENCPKHLLGDFAFAIWDARAQRLFCARDHMGMRQLIYHHAPGERFMFATEADAVVAHPGVSMRINQARITDFLDEIEGIDFTSTCFEALLRLPPAHWLSVDRLDVKIQRYWTLVPGPLLMLDSDAAYAAAFLFVLNKAVRCRLRSAGPIASMLSGGIDSNAVSAVAARLRRSAGEAALRTYSATASDYPDCAETRAIRSAAARGDYDPVLVDHADLAEAIPDLTKAMRELAEPFEGHMSMLRAIYRRAHLDGHRILLDGLCADVVLTAGNGIARALRKGKLVDAWRIARERRAFLGVGERPAVMMIRSAVAVFAPASLLRRRRRAIEDRNDRAVARGEQLVAPQLAREVDLAGRRRAYRERLGSGASLTAVDRARMISQPWVTAGRERYDRIASAFAIEPRDPFIDIRMIAFCLSLPTAQLEGDGFPKIILRRAMAGLVPDDVRWRNGKEHLGLMFVDRIAERWDTKDRPSSGWDQLGRYVSAPSLALATMDSETRLTLMTLAFWLERIETRGAEYQVGRATWPTK